MKKILIFNLVEAIEYVLVYILINFL